MHSTRILIAALGCMALAGCGLPKQAASDSASPPSSDSSTTGGGAVANVTLNVGKAIGAADLAVTGANYAAKLAYSSGKLTGPAAAKVDTALATANSLMREAHRAYALGESAVAATKVQGALWQLGTVKADIPVPAAPPGPT